MAQIKGTDGMTPEQINTELERGAKFVIFEYCISILVVSFKRGSDIHFVKYGESTISKSIGYILLTFVLGWWGIPWGPIYTVQSIYNNLKGGKDVTSDVVNAVNSD
jgi:hypothetical protein